MNAKLTMKRATWPEIIGYAIGPSMGSNMGLFFTMLYLLYYYTDVFGISAAVAGTIVMGSKIFDAVTDVTIGVLADKTKTRWGRYRPWMIIGAPLYFLALSAMFWGPDYSNIGKIVYAIVTYFLFTWAFTMCVIPGHSLKAVITDDPVQRMYIAIPSKIFTVMTMIVAGALALPMVERFGGGVDGYRKTAMVIGGIAFVVWWLSAYSARRHDNINTLAESATPSLGEIIEIVKSNRALQALVAAVGTNYIANAAISAVAIYVMTYVVGDQSLMFKVIMIMALIGAPMSIAVALLVKKYDKKTIFVWGSYLAILVPVLLLLFPGIFQHKTLFLVFAAVNAFLMPFSDAVTWALIPDCVEYGEWKTGVRAPGSVTSVFSFTNRVGLAVGAWVVGMALGWVGYVAKAPEQTPVVKQTLIYLYTCIPIFAHVCSIIAMKFYPISRTFYFQMKQDIEERKKSIQ